MGTNCKGVIVTDVKDLLLVSTLLEGAFMRLAAAGIQAEIAKDAEMGRTTTGRLGRMRDFNVGFSLSPSLGMLSAEIKLRGVSRTLTVHLSCNSDHLQLGRQTISMTIGDFGASEVLMKTALAALRVLGPAFYMRTDASDDPFESILPAPMSLGELLVRDMLSPYSYEKMATDYINEIGPLGSLGTFTEVFGQGIHQYHDAPAELDVASPSRRWKHLKEKMSDILGDLEQLPFWPTKIDDFAPAPVDNK